MAGPRVSVKMTNNRADVLLLDLATRVLAPEGDIVVEVDPKQVYTTVAGGSIPMHVVAGWLEFGATGIPARPAVRDTMLRNESRYMRSLRARLGALMSKKRPSRQTVASTLGSLGEAIQQDIKTAILNWREPRNADATIAKKGRNDPLVDTGRLANSFLAKWLPSLRQPSAAIKAAARMFGDFKGTTGAR